MSKVFQLNATVGKHAGAGAEPLTQYHFRVAQEDIEDPRRPGAIMLLSAGLVSDPHAGA